MALLRKGFTRNGSTQNCMVNTINEPYRECVSPSDQHYNLSGFLSDNTTLGKKSATFFGSRKVKYETTLTVHDSTQAEAIPIYHLLNSDGQVLNPTEDPKIPKEQARKIYQDMIRLNTMDNYLYLAQRQGRLGFYMTSIGEEGCIVGSAAALNADDLVFGQYREGGVLVWRGMSLESMMDMCVPSKDDPYKGHCNPMLYGSRELNVVAMSAPLATQTPQAAGAAFAMRRQEKNSVVACYFGEGAASEGDTHAAFNFAATLNCPVMFLCRNNGYAISTPAAEQYHGDGIAARGAAYGIPTIRVDGNDVLAVYNSVHKARQLCFHKSRPVLIEFITYRVGGHSTTDDSRFYRDEQEVKPYEEHENPIVLFKHYLIKCGYLGEEETEGFEEAAKKEVLETLDIVTAKQKPALGHMMMDVYDQMSQLQRRQWSELLLHLTTYQKYYPIMDQLEDKTRNQKTQGIYY